MDPLEFKEVLSFLIGSPITYLRIVQIQMKRNLFSAWSACFLPCQNNTTKGLVL